MGGTAIPTEDQPEEEKKEEEKNDGAGQAENAAGGSKQDGAPGGTPFLESENLPSNLTPEGMQTLDIFDNNTTTGTKPKISHKKNKNKERKD